MRPYKAPTSFLRRLALSSTRQSITTPRQSSLFARTMASSTEPAKMEWLVILPDVEGGIEKRMAVRPQHLARVSDESSSGFWLLGGAYFSEEPKAGQNPPPIIGSAMLAYASSKEEVLNRLKQDIYTESGVWDWEKVQIWPFKSAVRKGM